MSNQLLTVSQQIKKEINNLYITYGENSVRNTIGYPMSILGLKVPRVKGGLHVTI